VERRDGGRVAGQDPVELVARADAMTNIELYGIQVIPRVRELLA
jgi:hypothetical protein